VPPVREPGDISDLDQQPGGAGWPIPSRLISVVPVALSAAISSLSAAFLRWQARSRSAISSAATRRRACPARSRGRTRPSRTLAWAADSAFFAPPGIRSASSWQIIRM